jgi:hypothetical protein
MFFHDKYITDNGRDLLNKLNSGLSNVTITWTKAATSALNKTNLTPAQINALTDIKNVGSVTNYSSSGYVTQSEIKEKEISGNTEQVIAVTSQLQNGTGIDGLANCFGVWGKIVDDPDFGSDTLICVAFYDNAQAHGTPADTIPDYTYEAWKGIVDLYIVITGNSAAVSIESGAGWYPSLQQFNELLNRTVTTHGTLNATTGDAQDIYGVKTFKSGVMLKGGNNIAGGLMILNELDVPGESYLRKTSVENFTSTNDVKFCIKDRSSSYNDSIKLKHTSTSVPRYYEIYTEREVLGSIATYTHDKLTMAYYNDSATPFSVTTEITNKDSDGSLFSIVTTPSLDNLLQLGSNSRKFKSIYATTVYADISATNISASSITATTLTGSLVGNADTATKAAQDASGNTITSYYCTLSTAQTIGGNKTFTGTVSFNNTTSFASLKNVNVNGYLNVINLRSSSSNYSSTSISTWSTIEPYSNGDLDLGSSNKKFNNVYANRLNGVIPYIESTSNIPVGSIVLLKIGFRVNPCEILTKNAGSDTWHIYGDTSRSDSSLYLGSIEPETNSPLYQPTSLGRIQFRVISYASANKSFLAIRIE